MIELTVNEFRRLFDALALTRNPALTSESNGRTGDADTKPALVTTEAASINNGHEVRLSC